MPRCNRPARNARSITSDRCVTNTVKRNNSGGNSRKYSSITVSDAQSMSDVKQNTGRSSHSCGPAARSNNSIIPFFAIVLRLSA